VLRFASLGSGSGGNALLVEAREGSRVTRVLLDCGFNGRVLVARLARLGLAPEQLDAILVTHEHSDHVGGVAVVARRHRLPVYASEGTARAGRLDEAGVALGSLASAEVLAIGALEIRPYAVPHDAAEPLQFVFSDGASRLGVLTDIGTPTAAVQAALHGVDALVLEANHELDLLWGGPYPSFLKARIAGALGHLSNAQAASLLAALDTSRLRCLVAAHLSSTNNRVELARAALSGALGWPAEAVVVADQAQGCGWQSI
jgi:phosphoribosyl 1,2-cyclic phosphodiesterase